MFICSSDFISVSVTTLHITTLHTCLISALFWIPLFFYQSQLCSDGHCFVAIPLTCVFVSELVYLLSWPHLNQCSSCNCLVWLLVWLGDLYFFLNFPLYCSKADKITRISRSSWLWAISSDISHQKFTRKCIYQWTCISGSWLVHTVSQILT